MNNQDFQFLAQTLLKNSNNSQNSNKINKISNIMNSNQGQNLASELNKMANNNPTLNNAINSAKSGDINSAAQALSGMMNTKDGQNLANILKNIIGE